MEASPGYFCAHGDIGSQPNNWNNVTQEPIYTLPHILYMVNPRTKFVVSLRDPVDRLYSHYRYYCVEDIKSPWSSEEFNHFVIKDMAKYKSCLAQRSLRSCAFDIKLQEDINLTKVCTFKTLILYH